MKAEEKGVCTGPGSKGPLTRCYLSTVGNHPRKSAPSPSSLTSRRSACEKDGSDWRTHTAGRA